MPALRIGDLAQAMIEQLAPEYGYDPKDITINVIGTRPGEKRDEELMTQEEAVKACETEDMFIVLSEEGFGDYPGAKPLVKTRSYSSRDETLLTRQELKELLASLGNLRQVS